MEKDWKIRQKLYHKINVNHDDDLNKLDIQKSDDIIEHAVNYFNNSNMQFVYPAKSYVVAICYAYWLAKDFKENFYELLDDKELLYNNDPYFKRYSNDKKTYDTIISKIMPIDEAKGIIPDIKQYYLREFLIDTSIKEL